MSAVLSGLWLVFRAVNCKTGSQVLTRQDQPPPTTSH